MVLDKIIATIKWPILFLVFLSLIAAAIHPNENFSFLSPIFLILQLMVLLITGSNLVKRADLDIIKSGVICSGIGIIFGISYVIFSWIIYPYIISDILGVFAIIFPIMMDGIVSIVKWSIIGLLIGIIGAALAKRKKNIEEKQ
jgi:hypothetical protein